MELKTHIFTVLHHHVLWKCCTINGPNITDEGIKQLCEADLKLRELDLLHTRLGDGSVALIVEHLPLIEDLLINDTIVTDAGLESLIRLANLKRLTIQNSQIITDAGLAHVGKIETLEVPSLDGTGKQFTDAGLKHLKKLTNLNELYIARTQVTPVGIADLQAALPNCKISHE